ncbi:hypothetical protein IGI37_000771 [Enterococcus sp. AZ194]|uniref:hypothetical protein n=1 Tax=Enterococcus sp. AZ194 TaxID=2774629 RepID=UPI003F221D33
MKKTWLFVLGLVVTIGLVGCSAKEKTSDDEKQVTAVVYEYVKEKSKKQGADTPRFVEDKSNATVYDGEEDDAYYILLEKMKKENRTESVDYHLYKVEKDKKAKYVADNVSEADRHEVGLDSLKKLYEVKNVELQ